MKKLLFVVILSLAGWTSIQAQVFKLGGNIGIPMGDASDISDLTAGADLYIYFFDVDSFFNLGVNVGYRNFFGKDIDILGASYTVDNVQYLPVTAAGRVTLFSTFYAGADLGYAFGLSDNTDGGFFAKPVIGIDVANAIEVFVAYDLYTGKYKLSDIEGIDDYKFGSLNAGILFEF